MTTSMTTSMTTGMTTGMTTSMTVQIDFDAASAAWMANKIRRGPMLYYACTEHQKNGSPCPHLAVQEPGSHHRCKRHSKKQLLSLPGGSAGVGSADSPALSHPRPTKVVRDRLQIVGL